MRRLLLAVACVLTVGSAQAQITFTPAMIMPSPLGIVLSIGQWLLKDGKPAIYYIEVAGSGATSEEARNNGFRLAVEQAIGSLIASETEVQNGRVVRDEIISYASGYVDKFEIVNSHPTNNGYRVVMKVWVGRSALANRLLNKTQKGNEIDGSRVSVQLQTLRNERGQGDRILQTVLNDFPRRAFNITIDSNTIKMNGGRGGQLTIPYELKWSHLYLQSLYEALKQTGQERANANYQVWVTYKPPENWIRNEGGSAAFDDGQKPAMIWQRFVQSEPRLQVSLLDAQNRPLYRGCYLVPELDHFHQYNIPKKYLVEQYYNQVRINGDKTVPGVIQLNLGTNTEIISRINRVEFDVVLTADCTKT
jgi:hypothetical protein